MTGGVGGAREGLGEETDAIALRLVRSALRTERHALDPYDWRVLLWGFWCEVRDVAWRHGGEPETSNTIAAADTLADRVSDLLTALTTRSGVPVAPEYIRAVEALWAYRKARGG